jgi:hypothetical protein
MRCAPYFQSVWEFFERPTTNRAGRTRWCSAVNYGTNGQKIGWPTFIERPFRGIVRRFCAGLQYVKDWQVGACFTTSGLRTAAALCGAPLAALALNQFQPICTGLLKVAPLGGLLNLPKPLSNDAKSLPFSALIGLL